MSNVAVLKSERPEPRARDYLGPATVLETGPNEVRVLLPTGAEARARLALAFAYEPQPDDEVLVIGNADGHYVIGVLRGTGKAVLSFPGDVELSSVGGVVEISGGKGVRVRAPEVEMQASKLRVLAGAVVQRFASLHQRVVELLSVQAGASHTVVEGASFSQSKSATLQTEEKVLINGKEIHLG